MSITVLQALLITLFCIISNLMFPLLGDIGGYFGLGRPLIAGTITGLILGDVKTGMMIGASLNAVYMSSQAVGNVMSTDVTMAGYIATALSMAGSNDPAMALALSIPIGLLGSMLFTMQNAVSVFFSHKCDEYAAKGQVKKMWLVGIGIPLVVFNVMGRDYDAAVIVSGTCGFGMGATPNAMANMQAICDRYSPSVKAYLLIPLVGSLFADFLNSLVITVFINFI